MHYYIKTKVLVVLYFVLVVSCSSESESLPDGILEEDVMVQIISDLQLLEAVQKSIPGRGIDKVAMRDTSYSIVFNQYNTNYTEFDSSLRAYSRQPKIMGEMMEQVAERLNNQK